jgi:hypothetical protein
MLRARILTTVAFALWQTASYAQMNHQHASEAACEETILRCATKVTPAFSPDGTLWLAWMAGGQVSVANSKDEGHSFSAPLLVTNEPLDLDWGPDSRPKIVIDRNGGIALAFSIFKDKAFNGQVLYTRSADGGQSFAALRPITPSNESQRFEALALDADGSLFVAWLDKRNRVPAQQNGQKYEGAGLFFASSNDGGATYSESRLVQDNVCECCRLGVAFAGPGHPVIVFRNIFEDSMRDHAVVTFTDPTTPGAISTAGTYHVTWSTNGKVRKGLFYAHSRDGGRTFSNPLPIGQPDRNPSRPYIVAGPQDTELVWKEFDGEKTTVKLMTSQDDGESWSEPKVVSSTSDASDHPLLISDGRRTYLSWMTKADGYRFQAIEEEP